MIKNDSLWAACIVYYQDMEALSNLMQCLESQTLKPTEVFIVDNNSEIQIRPETFKLQVNVFKSNENRGFAGAANISIKNAIEKKYRKIILLSQDVLMENDSCEKILNSISSDNQVVFPTMINRKNSKIFSNGGTINKFTGKIKLQKNNLGDKVSWADGSCLGFTSNTFLNVNGLFEKYFMYFEDVDFCYRIKNLGGHIVHAETTTSQNPNGPSSFLRSRNSIIFARRTNSILMQFSTTIRNFIGAILLFAKFDIKNSFSRLFGIYKGWKSEIE